MPYLLILGPMGVFGAWLIAQSTDSQAFDWGTLIAQLGIAAGAVWWALRAEKRAEVAEARQQESEQRERDTKDEQLEIYRELAPMLQAATAALDSTTRGLAQQVEYARADSPPGPRELRDTLERIVTSLESLDKRLPQPRPRER